MHFWMTWLSEVFGSLHDPFVQREKGGVHGCCAAFHVSGGPWLPGTTPRQLRRPRHRGSLGIGRFLPP